MYIYVPTKIVSKKMKNYLGTLKRTIPICMALSIYLFMYVCIYIYVYIIHNYTELFKRPRRSLVQNTGK